MWAAAARAEGAHARAAELLLLALASAPALALTAPFAAATRADAARALLYLALLLGVVAVGSGSRPRAQRAGWVAAVAAWTAAAPLAALLLRDVGVAGAAAPWLRAAAPPLAAVELLDGGPLGPPVLALVIALAIVLAPRGWRALGGLRARRGAALALGALTALAGSEPAGATPQVRAAQPLLGAHVRPGEPDPVRVELEGARGGRLAARSFGHRYAGPAGAGAATLAATPLGGGRRLALEWQPTEGAPWEALAHQLPEPRVVPGEVPLVGALGPNATELAAALLPEGGAAVVALAPDQLPLLAASGEAIDLVVASAGAASRPEAALALQAWAGAGGVLVCAARDDLLAVARAPGLSGLSGPRRTPPWAPWDVQPLGAGLLIGPSAPDLPLAAGEGVDPRWRAELTRRLRARARRVALEGALGAGETPAPGRAQVGRAGVAALAAALALGLLAPLGAGGALGPTLARAAATTLGLALAVGVAAGPRGAVYASSAQVLELPAGGRVARRLALVRLRAVRPTEAVVDLAGPAPPRPRFAGGLEAIGAEALLQPTATGWQVRAPLRGHERAYARLDALRLPGSFEVAARGRTVTLANGTGLPLRRAFALLPGGVLPLADLEPGARVELDLSAPLVPFARWRWSSDDPAELRRRQLVAAALTGRDLRAGLVVVGEAPSHPTVAAGVAGEHAAPTLVIVVAAVETP